MSVNVLIEGDPDIFVSISGQATFENKWVPIAEKIGLVFVPEFASGIPVTPATCGTVIAELKQLEVEFNRDKATQVFRHDLRILIAILEEHVLRGGRDAYVG